MSHGKRYQTLLSVSIITIILFTSGYFYYLWYLQPVIPAIEAIPEETAIIVRTENIKTLKETLDKSNVWSELKNQKIVNDLADDLNYLDSLNDKYPTVSDILEGRTAYYSICKCKDKYSGLLTLSLSYTREGKRLNRIIKKITHPLSPQKHKSGLSIYYSVNENTTKDVFYYTFREGVFIGSYDRECLLAAMSHLSKGKSISKNSHFISVKSTAGKKVDANIFVNPPYLKDLLSGFLNIDFDLLEHFSSWSEMDLISKENEFFLNGYTSPGDDTSGYYLNKFEGQKAQKRELTQFLPFNTSRLLFIGLSDADKFLKGVRSSISEDEIQILRQKYGLNIPDDISGLIGNEIAICSLSDSRGSEENSFLYVGSGNIDKLYEQIKKLAFSERTMEYRGFSILVLEYPRLSNFFIENKVFDFHAKYAIKTGNYLIISENEPSVKLLINTLLSDQTLDRESSYINYSENVPETNNFYYNIRLDESTDFLRKYVKEDYFESVNSSNGLKNFTIQFSNKAGLYYTNIYLNYSQEKKEKNYWEWKLKLDAPIIRSPQIVKTHLDMHYRILVQDSAFNLYFIHPKGSILWQLPLTASIKGKIQCLDVYENAKIQYYFIAGNYLYALDANGNALESFPKKLVTEAAGGLTAFDYDNKKNYRLLYCGLDKKIYNLDKWGVEVRGWREVKTDDTTSLEFQYLSDNSNDYLIFSQHSGKVIMTDRRGRTKMKINRSFTNSIKSLFYINETNSKGFMLTTDTNGDVVYIPDRGKVSKTSFKKWQDDPWFEYIDLDNNMGEDFLFLSDNSLIAWDRYKKTIFSRDLLKSKYEKPVLCHTANGDIYVFTVNKNHKKIIIQTIHGQQSMESFIGRTEFFDAERIDNNKHISLFTANKKELYYYHIY